MSYQIEHDIPSSITLAEAFYTRYCHRDLPAAQLNNFEPAHKTGLHTSADTNLAAWYIQPIMTLKEKWEAFTTRIGLNRLVGNISSWINTEDRAELPPNVFVSEWVSFASFCQMYMGTNIHVICVNRESALPENWPLGHFFVLHLFWTE